MEYRVGSRLHVLGQELHFVGLRWFISRVPCVYKPDIVALCCAEMQPRGGNVAPRLPAGMT